MNEWGKAFFLTGARAKSLQTKVSVGRQAICQGEFSMERFYILAAWKPFHLVEQR
jgi:hypothetical protein